MIGDEVALRIEAEAVRDGGTDREEPPLPDATLQPASEVAPVPAADVPPDPAEEPAP